MLDSVPSEEVREPTVHTARARYLTPDNAFREKLPPVPAMTFRAARDQALDTAAPTGIVVCDIADRLASPVPATTPLLLARYLRIRAGESLATEFRATAEIYYVISGNGETANRDDRIAWAKGDVFVLPGGGTSRHAAATDAVLWIVTNEPEVAFHHLEPPARTGGLAATHYPAEEIRAHLDAARTRADSKDQSGRAVIFATESFEKMLSVTPSMTLALNSMEPGRAQRGHRHNSVAVTLPIDAEDCYSSIDGTRTEWSRFATMITPPTSAHSHHNEGGKVATFLIVQDGGLHYHCRTIGFSFDDG